jgi:hypothetical protein
MQKAARRSRPFSFGHFARKCQRLARFDSKAKLLEVASIGGFALRENGHQFMVGLRPNPAKQVVGGIETL